MELTSSYLVSTGYVIWELLEVRKDTQVNSYVVVKVKPHRWGWKVFEVPGVEPVFPDKDQAIDYAQNRACFRSGEVRIFDSTGNVERIIPFDDANRKL